MWRHNCLATVHDCPYWQLFSGAWHFAQCRKNSSHLAHEQSTHDDGWLNQDCRRREIVMAAGAHESCAAQHQQLDSTVPTFAAWQCTPASLPAGWPGHRRRWEGRLDRGRRGHHLLQGGQGERMPCSAAQASNHVAAHDPGEKM